MLESGGRLLSHALTEGLVNEVILYLAPILGGANQMLIHGEGIASTLKDLEVTKIGSDLRLRGMVV